ncbi:peptidase [Hymenobacter gummosus]|uniref:Peptidase n=1 Tax=Hymenobacter gummosus TaxID=1776032 RepID=A0A431U2Z5_9BACT|nr:S41 family peptidase [Hymenobacter gummosus]RTQ49768.1 peptidase [Hymenobacter gummosus]
MNLRRYLPALLLLVGPLSASRHTPPAAGPFREDAAFFWQTVHDDYAYFDQKQTDWDRVRARYLPQADTVRSRRALVRLLEQMLQELYDHHAALGTNRPDSPRLVPSGADVYAEWEGGRAVVRELRPGFGAERAGLRPGVEILSVGGVPVAQARQPYQPQCLRAPDAAADNYALNTLLAGRHDQERRWRIRSGGAETDVQPDQPRNLLENPPPRRRLDSRRLGRVGYIRINNCLFDHGLIPAFDSTLTALADTKGLVLDLRDTPSGGNTTVARALLGRFITQEQGYQRHELVNEQRQYGIRRFWLEMVAPRPAAYRRPVVVLAGRWTGSMGEGITTAFDGMKRATVVGSPLARLRGGIYSYRLPASGISFSIPVEKLYQLDGTPREQFEPKVTVKPAADPAQDPALDKALQLLR